MEFGEDEKPKKESRHKKFNIGAYRGLVDTVQGIKDKVEKDRAEALAKEGRLQELLRRESSQAEKVQKELSVQLRCAGRSYQQLLTANRELAEELRTEAERRSDAVEGLEKQVKELRGRLAEAAKPWLEEISARDLKILKLQEANTELRKRVQEEAQKVGPIVESFTKELKEKEQAMDTVLMEAKSLREVNEELERNHAEEIQALPLPLEAEIRTLKRDKKELEDAREDDETRFKREKRELDKKIQGLQKELDAVDHTPFEKKIEQQAEGYARLVKDFELKTQVNADNMQKMRDGFEEVIHNMDQKLQHHEREAEKRLRPYQDTIKRREAKIERLENQIKEMKEAEVETRAKEQHISEELRAELGVARASAELAQTENYNLRRQVEKYTQEMEQGDGPMNKVKFLEKRLDEVTLECANLVKKKDNDIKDKIDMIGRLQAKAVEDAKRFEEFADTWDKRIQEKEKGYNKAVAELEFAEGQIQEERLRTSIEKEKVKQRERDILRLQEEHSEELRWRQSDHDELVATIAELEEAVEVEARKPEVLRARFQADMDAFRQRSEERVDDLLVELNRRDRLYKDLELKMLDVKSNFEEARAAWEEKERELEIFLRSRDRQLTALKNEIEFMNDSWEIKYQRLLEFFDKLQKKYDEQVGPNGVAEAFSRAAALKKENDRLTKEIKDLNAYIDKLKKEIRSLKLDIDQIMKETADVIAEKERGIAEMAGDQAKLEHKYREELLLRFRLLKQKDAERLALAESFQARVDQLEQLMDAMRFNDREELLQRITHWKRQHEDMCKERDDAAASYKELLAHKEAQLRGMVAENDQIRMELQVEKVEAREALSELDRQWKIKEAAMELEKEKSDMEWFRKVEEAKQRKEEEHQELLREVRMQEDPEKTELRNKIEEMKEQMAQVEAGKISLIQENTELRAQKEAAGVDIEGLHSDYQSQLAGKDKVIKDMQKQHEELKGVLQAEMQRAQDACKDIEGQVRRFPDPFELEIQEMKDKYAQMQVGVQRMQLENVQLRAENLDQKKELEEEISHLEEALGLAKTLLQEVSTLDTLRHLSQSQIDDLERATGLDLDKDGKIGGR